MMDNTTTKSYLHVLNGGEYQAAQFLVKLIQLNNLVKRSTYGILMGLQDQSQTAANNMQNENS